LRELQGANSSEAQLPNVYMIGDNPESGDSAQGPPAHKPTHLVKDVEQAVRWAIHRELSKSGL